MAGISDPAIHGVWLLVDQFREYLHQKYSFGDNIQFNTYRLIRYLNKVFPNQSLESNEVTISIGKKVMVFRHEYQTKVKSRQRFIDITGKTLSAVPKPPTNDNSSEWDEKCVPLKRLLRNGGWSTNDGQKFRDAGHHVNSSSSGSRSSPQLLENKVTLHTAFDSNSKITMTGLGDELNSRKRRRTSEKQEGEEEEGKEATSTRLLLLGGSDESSGLATASLSQVEDLRLRNDIQLLGSSFESSSSLQSSAPRGKKNDIQKQKTTTKTYWESPEAKKLFNPLPNESTLNAIDNQIEIRRQANNSSSGYLPSSQNVTTIVLTKKMTSPIITSGTSNKNANTLLSHFNLQKNT